MKRPGAAEIIAVSVLVGAAAAAACGPGARGGPMPRTGSGGDGHVEVGCVLLADGGLCTFTAIDKPGARCVKVLYGVSSGTVVASDVVCSGSLGAGEASTRVVKYPTRPGDVCGAALVDCTTRPVSPGQAMETAAGWQGELKARYTGPITADDCKKLVEHKYEIYTQADCGPINDPVQKEGCQRTVREERDRELPYLIEDCQSYYKRTRFDCEMQAKNQNQLYECEDRHSH